MSGLSLVARPQSFGVGIFPPIHIWLACSLLYIGTSSPLVIAAIGIGLHMDGVVHIGDVLQRQVWSGVWCFIDLGQVFEMTLDKIYQGAAIRPILSQYSW